MKNRYHMSTKDGRQFVEMPHTTGGLNFLKSLRRGRKDILGGQHIKEVLQAHPSDVTVGILHYYS